MSWNNLPIEIILQVLKCTSNIYNCSLINKKWHSIAYYLLYKELNIDISNSEHILHTLSHSQYNPGLYVTRLNIHTLNPNPFQEEEYDPLLALLRSCPHVREINFTLPLSTKECEYFETSLRHSFNKCINNIIYPFPFTTTTYTHYLNCGFILQSSLSHLQVATRKYNYQHLRFFLNSIKTIDIMPGALKNMVEYENLVSLFQNLISVKVDFSLLDTEVGKVPIIHDKHIKNLDITYAVQPSDMDVRLIKNKFSTINNLNLKFNTTNQPDHFFQSFFFRDLTDVPNYRVSFTDSVNQLVLMIQTYHTSLLQPHSNILDVRYITQSQNKLELILNKTNQLTQAPILALTSKSSFNLKEISQATRNILTDQSLAKYFTTLRFFFDHHQSVYRYLIPTLSKGLKHIDSLVLTGGSILPMMNITVKQMNKIITKIAINHSNISWLESLQSFLSHFATVSLRLNQCKLHREAGTNEIKMNIPDVCLNELYLDISNSTTTLVYIKVKQGKMVKYYLLDIDKTARRDLSQEIDQVMYHRHLMVSQKDMMFIHVHVNSLQNLTICYCKHTFTLDFNDLK